MKEQAMTLEVQTAEVYAYPKKLFEGEIRSFLIEKGVASELVRFQDVPAGISADLSVPCFPLARILRKSPTVIAQELAADFVPGSDSILACVEPNNGYVNFSVDRDRFGASVLRAIFELGSRYGSENIGKGEVVVVDMSSPNIAKPMGVGHLRSTDIGHSVARLLEFTGHNTIRDNHLGDWGTQFGMLLKAYELWGDEVPGLHESGKEVKGLYQLYVRINQEIAASKGKATDEIKEKVEAFGIDSVEGLRGAYDKALSNAGSQGRALEQAIDEIVPPSELELAGKEWFRRLEADDPEAREKWQWAVDLSLREFHQVYKILGVNFDYELGESFYVGMIPDLLKQIEEQPFVKNIDGALVADLSDAGLGKMYIRASDGRSLYVTRDLATAIYRQRDFKAQRLLYVVGADQKLYFRQWFEVLRRMGYEIADDCQHLYFGMITLPEGKMSTRKGRVVFLEDVIKEGIRRAGEVIKAKNHDLFKNRRLRKKVATQIAVGAIIWSDISKDIRRDIVFDWDEMLSFDGYAAPYVQYVHARGNGVLRKADVDVKEIQTTEGEFSSDSEIEQKLVMMLADFPDVVAGAATETNPASVAEYVYKLAKAFNQFYHDCTILGAEGKLRESRLRLVAATTQVIRNALWLLGIEAPDEM